MADADLRAVVERWPDLPGAVRAGITEVVLPKFNQADLEDLPEEVRDKLTIHLVEELGEALANTATGYSVVYHTEIALIFLTLIVLGPLVRHGVQGGQTPRNDAGRIGLADFPT